MGRFDSVFREHSDVIVEALSARLSEEARRQRYRQLLSALRDEARPFLDTLASTTDLHRCMARLEGRGLVTETLRTQT